MAELKYRENTKRLAKNAAVLYVRQIAIILINFLATRELLDALGVVDFGLANVIGGVVAMFSFLSGMLSVSSSRYFNFDLGRRDFKGLKETFNTSLQIYAFLIVILAVLCETIGLWTFQNKLVIPEARFQASEVFFHFTVLSFLLNIAAIPFTSLVISHENMRAFSYLSIFEALGKLCIIYLLFLDYFDRLSAYGALLFAISALHFLMYFGMCFAIYPESRIHLHFSGQKFKELLLFSGWNIWGSCASLFTNILVNILLNNFFGAALNTARAVGMQVSSSLTTFSNNFLTAVRPQIVKYWAARDVQQSYNLVYQSSKFGYLFVLLLSIPILLDPEFVLRIWIGEVPDYSAQFMQFALVQVLIGVLSYPLMTLTQATGKIALYQTLVGSTYWLTFPLVYIAFKFGASPLAAMIIGVNIEFAALVLRILLTHRCSNMPFSSFLQKSILPCAKVSLTAPILPYLATLLPLKADPLRFAVVCATSFLSTALCSIAFALPPETKSKIKPILKNAWNKFTAKVCH